MSNERILVADDNPANLKLVSDLLGWFGMPDLNGLDATRQIKRALPKCKVLIFTAIRNGIVSA